MDIATPTDLTKNAALQKTRINLEQPASPDRFAEIRKAKKKEKRARHRARLKRPNTAG